jgi:hypothetical protein
MQAPEFKWLVQAELAPQVLSGDEGNQYPMIGSSSDSEVEDDEMLGSSGKKSDKVSAWNLYQRINNQGQPVVRADGTDKALYEVRHPWYLKDSVSHVYTY